MKNISKLAIQFRKSIEECNLPNILPVYEYFPKNCCEHTSVLFGYYVRLTHPEYIINIIRGEHNSENGLEYHLWLEINKMVFDLTLDQFDDFNAPIYGAENNPIGRIFHEDMRELIENYMPYYFDKCMDLSNFTKALSLIVNKLNINS